MYTSGKAQRSTWDVAPPWAADDAAIRRQVDGGANLLSGLTKEEEVRTQRRMRGRERLNRRESVGGTRRPAAGCHEGRWALAGGGG